MKTRTIRFNEVLGVWTWVEAGQLFPSFAVALENLTQSPNPPAKH